MGDDDATVKRTRWDGLKDLLELAYARRTNALAAKRATVAEAKASNDMPRDVVRKLTDEALVHAYLDDATVPRDTDMLSDEWAMLNGFQRFCVQRSPEVFFFDPKGRDGQGWGLGLAKTLYAAYRSQRAAEQKGPPIEDLGALDRQANNLFNAFVVPIPEILRGTNTRLLIQSMVRDSVFKRMDTFIIHAGLSWKSWFDSTIFQCMQIADCIIQIRGSERASGPKRTKGERLKGAVHSGGIADARFSTMEELFKASAYPQMAALCGRMAASPSMRNALKAKGRHARLSTEMQTRALPYTDWVYGDNLAAIGEVEFKLPVMVKNKPLAPTLERRALFLDVLGASAAAAGSD